MSSAVSRESQRTASAPSRRHSPRRTHNTQVRRCVRVASPRESDSEFLWELARQARASRSKRLFLRLPSFLRNTSRIAAMALLGMVMCGLLFVSGSEPANAIFGDDWCSNNRIPLDTGIPDDSLIDFGKNLDENGELGQTTWAQYGLAGITWHEYWVDCSDRSTYAWTGVANYLITPAAWIAGLAITMFQWVFSGHIINKFIAAEEGEGAGALDLITKALDATFVDEMMAVAVVVGALVLAWRALIQGAGLSDILSKILIMILIAGFMTYYSANASDILKYFNDKTNQVTAVAYASFGSVLCEISAGNDCEVTVPDAEASRSEGTEVTVACPTSLPDDQNNLVSVEATAVDCIGQILYHSLIFIPWANGVLGSVYPPDNEEGEPLTKEEFDDKYQDRIRIAAKVFRFQGFSRGEVPVEASEQIKLYGVKANDCVRGHAKAEDFHNLMDEFGKQRIDDWVGATEHDEYLCKFYQKGVTDGDEKAGYYTLVGLMNEDKKDIFHNVAGKKEQNRLMAGVIALIGALFMAFVLFIIAFVYMLLQIATVAFAIVAPIAMLLGLVPVVGVQIFLKWGQLFLGTFLKRIALALFVGFLMLGYSIILMVPISLVAQVGLIVALAILGIVYRKKVIALAGMSDATATAGKAAKLGGKAAGGTAKLAGKGGKGAAVGAVGRSRRGWAAQKSMKGAGIKQRTKAYFGSAAKSNRQPNQEKTRARRDGSSGQEQKNKDRGYE